MKPARELPLRAADHGELVFDLAQAVEHAAQLLLAQLHVHRPLRRRRRRRGGAGLRSIVGVGLRLGLGLGLGVGVGLGVGLG